MMNAAASASDVALVHRKYAQEVKLTQLFSFLNVGLALIWNVPNLIA